jgi:hypothetical protein
MRSAILATVPLLALLLTEPAAAQISATIHVGPIRIGGAHHVPPQPRRIVVVDYDHRHFGHWKQTARHWRPVTVYVYQGRYYERPIRNAKPIVIYRYRDSYFMPPRDREWNDYRARYERNEWRRDDRRDNRPDRRDDHRNDRRDDRRDRSRRG